MTDPIAFLLAALALLAIPGPTNTLLATAGATLGFRRALRLIPAELAGYTLSILTLALLLGPLALRYPALALALKIGCGLYLARLGCRLWCHDADKMAGEPIGTRQVLLATLLNPKGLVFAFAILPHLAEGRIRQSLPYDLALLALIAGVAIGWIALAALAGPHLDNRGRTTAARRCAAVVLAGFAVMLSGSALAALF